MALRARQPTGAVAWPLILVEGGEKAGKSCTAFELSSSEKVGRTFVLDMGEGSADEYKSLGRYEVLDHNGTFVDFLGQVKEATAVPMVDGKPNVIVIDSSTVLWESIKDWADGRARRGAKARKLLASDPDADVSIPMNIWTDAAERWGQVIHALRYWDGIGILIARGKEVAKVGKDGQPVTGQTDYKIEAHKSLGFQVSAHVRCEGMHRTRLVSVRSLHATVPPQGLMLPESMPLEHLVFDVLGAGGSFAVSTAVAPTAEERIPMEDAERLAAVVNSGGKEARTSWLARFGCPPAELHPDRLTEANDFVSDLEVVA
jgi:hypothetical protein